MPPSEFMYKAAVAGVTWEYNVRASRLAWENVLCALGQSFGAIGARAHVLRCFQRRAVCSHKYPCGILCQAE